jgi:hypothetical protein
MDMIRHQSAPLTYGASGNRMLGISCGFDNSAVLDMQQQTATWMAETTIAFFNFGHQCTSCILVDVTARYHAINPQVAFEILEHLRAGYPYQHLRFF